MTEELPNRGGREAWTSLLRSHATLVRRLETDLQRETGLALADFDVLAQLALADGELRMSELADRALISRSGMTRRVARLVEEGLVRRANADGGRAGRRRVPDRCRRVPPNRDGAGSRAWRHAALRRTARRSGAGDAQECPRQGHRRLHLRLILALAGSSGCDAGRKQLVEALEVLVPAAVEVQHGIAVLDRREDGQPVDATAARRRYR